MDLLPYDIQLIIYRYTTQHYKIIVFHQMKDCTRDLTRQINTYFSYDDENENDEDEDDFIGYNKGRKMWFVYEKWGE